MIYKCRICKTKFQTIYTTPKGLPQSELERDRFELCCEHFHKKWNPEAYKKYFLENSKN